jgi:catechol 2,3-dioxygenase-like lactoylglutathione lyase family enzyme
MNLQPHHLGLVVSDLARSTAFYEALGFRITSDLSAEDGSRAIRFLSLGAFQLELFWYAEPLEPRPAAAPAGRGRLGFRHLALRTDDLEGALAELKSAGHAPADLEIRVVPAGFKLVFLSDPDGVEIELMQEA